MALGLYKPGQGYWVRVLTAVGAGSLVLATAMWAWSQAQSVAIPTPTWEVQVADVRGDVSPGMTLELQTIDPVDVTKRQPVGTAVVQEFASGTSGGRITIGEVSIDAGAATPADAEFIGTSSESAMFGGSDFSARIETATGNPAFERLYLQAGLAAGIMLLGSIGVFYFVGSHRNASEFLIATDGEMKKVNWSTRREVIGSTWVVIFAAFLIALLLYGVDNVFFALFSLIGLHG